MSALLVKYGASQVVIFPIKKTGGNDFAGSADWTPATGDVKLSIDGGNVANTTNLPVAVGGTGAALWALTLTAAECQGQRLTVQIVDAATKAVQDQGILLYTFGHASALYANDWGITAQAACEAALNAAQTESYPTAGAAASITQMNYAIMQFLHEAVKTGAVISIKKVDGATQAYELTLNNATNPTSVTRTA